MTANEIELIAGREAQQFIHDHEATDHKQFAFSQKTILGISPILIANQLAARKKAKEKFPSIYKTDGIVYPPSINLEQSSSELAAQFKAGVLNELSTPLHSGVDLTSGLGIDSFFISRIFENWTSVEPDISLLNISEHNHSKLGATNILYEGESAENFLSASQASFDFIFIDPSRRLESKKVFRFIDGQPNVVALLPSLLKRSSAVMIKASPLLDLQQGVKDLVSVRKIYVVAIDDEVKEVLFFCQPGTSSPPEIEAVNLSTSAASQPADRFQLSFALEAASVSQFSPPQKYLYEPAPWVLKAGAFKLAGQRFNLSKLSASTHLYTSNELRNDFPGRIFVTISLQPKQSELAKLLPSMKANVITRNYPLSVAELRKKLKVHDGGDRYVIGFSGQKEKFVAVVDRIK